MLSIMRKEGCTWKRSERNNVLHQLLCYGCVVWKAEQNRRSTNRTCSPTTTAIHRGRKTSLFISCVDGRGSIPLRTFPPPGLPLWTSWERKRLCRGSCGVGKGSSPSPLFRPTKTEYTCSSILG